MTDQLCETDAMLLILTFAGFAGVAYLIATALLAQRVLQNGSAQGSRLAFVISGLAVIAHLGVHMLATAKQHQPDLHFYAALSLVALGMSALTIAGAYLEKFDALGVLVFPLAAVFLGLYAGVGKPGTYVEPLTWPIQTHAGLALLAYATLAISTLLALALSFQERALRRRQLSGLLRALPPLTQTESLLFRTLGSGFLLLTLALMTGIVFVENLFAQHLAHKTILSILSWIVLCILLIGHWRFGWRGQRAVRWTLAAMALLLLAFFGSKFALELVLQRG